MKSLLCALSLLCVLRDSSGVREPLDPVRCGALKSFTAGDDSIFTLSVSRGRGLACAGRRDGDVVVWDAIRWKELRRIRAHKGPCYAAVPSPDGGVLATCGLDGAIKVWQADTGKHVRTHRAAGTPVTALAWTSSGRRLVAGGMEGVWVFEGEARDPALTVPVPIRVLDVRGDLAALGGLDGTVRVWDLAEGKELWKSPDHGGYVYAVAFHPSAGLLACAGADASIRLWNARTGKSLRVLEGQPGTPPRSLAFTPSGRFVLSGTSLGVQVWELESGKAVRTLEMAGATAWSIAPGLGGREIVAVGGDNSVWVWGGETRGAAASPKAYPMGFLGVNYVDNGGAHVQGVFPNSQAERAGFQVDDIIVGVDHQTIQKSEEFMLFMRNSREGDEVDLKIKRGDENRVIRVKLGRWDQR